MNRPQHNKTRLIHHSYEPFFCIKQQDDRCSNGRYIWFDETGLIHSAGLPGYCGVVRVVRREFFG